MEQQKNLTFYSDLSKNHEFVGRLKAILNRSNSSIDMCYITKAVDQRFTVYIEPSKNSLKNSMNYLTFSFHPYDLPFRETGTKDFSDSDIAALSELFEDFALTNGYEGQFFASKFFTPEYREKPHSIFVLKYTVDKKKNRFIVDDKKVSKHYAVVSMSNLAYYLDAESVEQKLVKCNLSVLQNLHEDFETAINQVNKYSKNSSTDLVVVEYYKDFETYECFIKEVSKSTDDGIINISLKDLIEKT